jgi:hypothetical protein
MDCQAVAITEYNNKSEIGHYKSLTDVTKMPIVSEDIDYNNHVCRYFFFVSFILIITLIG